MHTLFLSAFKCDTWSVHFGEAITVKCVNFVKILNFFPCLLRIGFRSQKGNT